MGVDFFGGCLTLALFLLCIVQFKKSQPNLIFSICLLFYIAAPSMLDVYIEINKEDAVELAALFSQSFLLGYLVSQIFLPFKRLLVEDHLYISFNHGAQLILIGYWLLSISIIFIVIYSGFDRVLIHELMSTRIQILLVFLLAFSLSLGGDGYRNTYIYLPIFGTLAFLLFSGSRIYLIPAIVFIVIFNLHKFSKLSVKSKFLLIIILLVILAIPILRNLSADILSERNLVALVGEWYFTYRAFIFSIENSLSFDYSFIELIFYQISPFLSSIEFKSSDVIINESINLDFGLASHYLADLRLLGVENSFSYFLIGFIVGVVNTLFGYYSKGFIRIVYMIFLSFTPILFRSGFIYYFAVLKSVLAYAFIIWLVLVVSSHIFSRQTKASPD
jgi:hypothetical protein